MDNAKPRRIRKIHGKSIMSVDEVFHEHTWLFSSLWNMDHCGISWGYHGHFPPLSWPALIVQILWATPRHRWWPRLCEELPGSKTSMFFEVFRCLRKCHAWKLDSQLCEFKHIETYWKPKVIGWSNSSSSVRIFYQPIQSQRDRISALSTFRTKYRLRRRVSAWANDDQKRTYSLLSHTYPLVI